MHITHELLLAVLDGKIPRKVLEEIVLEHLSAQCPVCAREIETFDWRRYRREVPHLSLYDTPFRRVAEAVQGRRAELERELEEANRWLVELRKVSPEERRGVVDRAHKRFRGEVFADLLVDEAAKHLPHDPWGAYSWADTAFGVQYHTSGIKKSGAVMVRIAGHRGNALRVMGRLVDAEKDFRFGRGLVDQNDVTDLSVCAEFDCLEGSFRKDKRELALAETLLKRAVLLYRLLGENELRARTEIKLGLVQYDQERPEEALETAERALADLSLEATPFLYLLSRFNLALVLEDLGKPQKALALLEEDREAQEQHFDFRMKLRREWLRGRIALAVGQKGEAEERLSSAREGFVAAEDGYDAAMVSLELALILLEKGETRRVKEIASEAFQIFGSQHVHPEALGSLKVFRDAAAAERLSTELVRKVLVHFKKEGKRPPEEGAPF